jgi:hypothetical protein
MATWPGVTDPADLSPRDRTAFAENWRSVLVWDALVGVTVTVAGILVGVLWSPAAGLVLALLGAAYIALGARRAKRWAAIRRANGL